MVRKRFLWVAIIVAFVAGFVVGAYLFQPVELIIPAEYHEQMCLLTWGGWSGDLCFLLIPMTERGRATHDLWSKWWGQCGVPKLKEALAATPRDKQILWSDWPSRFTYPDDHVVQELMGFARSKGIRLEQSPALR